MHPSAAVGQVTQDCLLTIHIHKTDKQQKNKSKKVLLSFQLPSNNKMETYNLFASEDTITHIRPSRVDGYLRGAYVEKTSVGWYFLPPLRPVSPKAPHMVLSLE